MRIAHFADLHLDTPFAWADPATARLRRRNIRGTLERIVRLAADEGVDAITSGGDLFEHDLIGPDTIAFLHDTLGAAGRPVFLAPGNHDWFGPQSPYARADWPANVHVFSADRLTPVELIEGITLWGAAHRAPANTDDFFAGFRPDRGGIQLALAHASERGGLAWQGSGKQPHAPFDAIELERAGIDFALLGHYHLPRDEARHSYPGNPDPLEFGETGERGLLLVTVQPDGRVERDRRIVATSQVHDVEVDLTGAAHREDVANRVGEAIGGRAGSVRLTLTGEMEPTAQVDLPDLLVLGAGLDGFVIRAGGLGTRYDLQAIASEPTVRGRFVRDARERIADEDQLRKVLLTGLRALDGRTDLDVA